MANTITVNPIADGERLGVSHITLVSDGAAGELTNQVVIDSSALAGGKAIRKIKEITSNLTGFTAVLNFRQTSNVLIVTLPSGHFHQEFDDAALVNPKGTGSTGDVACDTVGFTSLGDTGHITIEYVK